jgi:hypothetical protein
LETLLAGLEATAVAQSLRTSRWLYAATNTAHVFGIALLVGAIVPLNLRLLGLWPDVPRRTLVRVMVPVAATGLALAMLAGGLLFAVRAREYAPIGFLQAKLALVALGTLAALALHRSHGFLLDTAPDRRLKAHALLSLACWPLALVCGRLIAFAGD